MIRPLRLAEATDAHFTWMMGEAGPSERLTLPPRGVDQPWVLRWLRRTLPTLGGSGSWLMIVDGEVVGLCGYKGPPDADGVVEIGYGVAPERRRLGYATRAVAELIKHARRDHRVSSLVAETATTNVPSQRVVEANGFTMAGRGADPDDGEMMVWRLELP
ncbi:MAG TPA: GNAT family N-acetyltransferase [Caulobacteraceae bacterium]|jgi:RimJ/RimL family protein N-acetyltransferase|nr:GNAT family N-acetyltransferase [Caulobacteraceae bacterium]